MKPFNFAIRVIAGNHLAVRHLLAVAVERLVGVDGQICWHNRLGLAIAVFTGIVGALCLFFFKGFECFGFLQSLSTYSWRRRCASVGGIVGIFGCLSLYQRKRLVMCAPVWIDR